jgi:hypothetical protein
MCVRRLADYIESFGSSGSTFWIRGTRRWIRGTQHERNFSSSNTRSLVSEGPTPGIEVLPRPETSLAPASRRDSLWLAKVGTRGQRWRTLRSEVRLWGAAGIVVRVRRLVLCARALVWYVRGQSNGLLFHVERQQNCGRELGDCGFRWFSGGSLSFHLLDLWGTRNVSSFSSRILRGRRNR